MSVLFTINFHREAYQRELARARRRVILLGVWVAYFGVIGVVMGLYGRNRVQELVLGGVSHDMVSDPPAALLISH